MSANEDRDLKDAFEALGSSVQMTEPSFDQMTSRETLDAARWRQRRHRAALLAVAVAVPAFLALRAKSDRALDYERFTALTGIDLNEVTWEAPSDFLLDFPGRELLRRVPIIEIQAPAIIRDTVRPPDSNDTKQRSRS
ncbi:MAG TPA: hypothetical protein VFD64_07245 [Gemmatimonadaceae bacterium]|nr:hypothetical protein [Gemmatimonadaceae bacterium]